MLLALVVFNVVHPGRIMPGKESDFPSRKERKNYFRTSSRNSVVLLPITEPVVPASTPEEVNSHPKSQDVVPSTGYIH